MTVKFLPDAPTSIKCKPYPWSKAEGEIEEEWVRQEKALGRIKEGASQFVSPVFFIGKKDSGEKHVIIDYRIQKSERLDSSGPQPNAGDTRSNGEA